MIGKSQISVSGDASVALYAEHLARKNSEALSFIPHPKIVQYAERGQVLTALENDEPCGFVIFGNGWPNLKVYQACIQFDARRREHGMALVSRLIAEADARQCSSISLWCASDLESNEFWSSAGFSMVGVRAGGARRGRRHNCWRLALPEPAQLSLEHRAGVVGAIKSDREESKSSKGVTMGSRKALIVEEALNKALAAGVVENGSQVNADGTPRCIWGHGRVALGLPPVGGGENFADLGHNLGEEMKEMGLTLDAVAAIKFFGEVTRLNDRGEKPLAARLFVAAIEAYGEED